MQLAGLTLPDTALVTDAIALSRTVLVPYLFNHVMRGAFFAAALTPPDAPALDPELLTVSVVLHDLGLADPYYRENRYEVDSAHAARDFLTSHGVRPAEVQLVWDAIALHTTGSIALHKQPEVALCHAGIAADVVGRNLEQITAQHLHAILSAYPRLAFKQQFAESLCDLVARKPQTTYDNFIRDIGERFVEGYTRPSFADWLQNAPYDE